jgi:hypothetical protein
VTLFAEGKLALSERLVLAYDDQRPTPEDLAGMHAGVVRWREQLAGFRQRLTAVSIEPPHACSSDRSAHRRHTAAPGDAIGL